MFFCLDTKEPKNQGSLKIAKIYHVFPKMKKLSRSVYRFIKLLRRDQTVFIF